MAQHQTFGAGRRFAKGAGDDFPIGAADAERERADQHRAMRLRWLWNVFELRGVGRTRKKRDRAH